MPVAERAVRALNGTPQYRVLSIRIHAAPARGIRPADGGRNIRVRSAIPGPDSASDVVSGALRGPMLSESIWRHASSRRSRAGPTLRIPSSENATHDAGSGIPPADSGSNVRCSFRDPRSGLRLGRGEWRSPLADAFRSVTRRPKSFRLCPLSKPSAADSRESAQGRDSCFAYSHRRHSRTPTTTTR